MKKLLFTGLMTALSLFTLDIQAQNEKCATMQILEQRMKKDPTIKLRMQQSEIETQKWIAAHPKTHQKTNTTKSEHITTIPIVFHVIHTGEPIGSGSNISDAQIQSQIDILNEDFRLMNSDSLPDTHPFWFYTADAEIEFCLATRDPNGNATTGITRTLSSNPYFDVANSDDVKSTANGGKDNWDPTKYLNFWTFKKNPDWSMIAWATFPSNLTTSPELDGVAQIYNATGIHPNNLPGYNLGRTATHEVGHWLNLRHIWGDGFCGDDFVSDTQAANFINYGCPSFPHNANNACGTDEDGEMYMNYMDYTNDNCKNMFTNGQAVRMDAALNIYRAGLLTSLGCGSAIGVNEISFEKGIYIYPNPNNGNFTINVHKLKSENISISIYDLLGSRIQKFENIKSFPFQMDLNELSNGIYYVKINHGNKIATQKVVISK